MSSSAAGSPEGPGGDTGGTSPAGGSPGQELQDITAGMEHLSTNQPMHVKVSALTNQPMLLFFRVPSSENIKTELEIQLFRSEKRKGFE